MPAQSLFKPGENCCAVACADRVSFVVDADGYFRLFHRAAQRAERSIVILGWDFDSRTVLEHEEGREPVILGDFLNRLVQGKRQLEVKILDWDYPIVFGTDRELPPTLGISSWKPHRRIDFRFDDTHPVAGSHHQKIIIFDDRLAFVGGIDLTNKRWDTCDHRADEPRRIFEDKPYPPFHDVAIAEDGAAVEPIAEIARSRWLAATGERIRPVKVSSDPWPDIMPVHAQNGCVAVATTAPPTDESAGVKQIERLYLDMIAAARDYI
jgi:phospholipase D1/2